MKKFAIIMLLACFTFVASAQVLTKSTIKLPVGATYALYTGTTVDTLSSNQDSIQFPFLINQSALSKITVGANFAKRSGNDTLVTMRIYGKYFEGDSYTWLATATSANVTTTAIQLTSAYGTAVQYRYIKVNFIIAGTKSTGVKINKVEIKATNQ